MVPGSAAVLAKLATPRRYHDPAYMADIAPEIYGGDVDPALAHEFADKMRPGDSRGYLYQMLGTAGWTSLALLRCLRQRTLILAGDHDRLLPPVNAPLLPHPT